MSRRVKKKVARSADMFCGAGGSTTGFYEACQELGLGTDVLAINHWQCAVETHRANHPEARHLCEDIDKIRPSEVWEGQMHLLLAGPSCTNFSIAKGGKPRDEQDRASAWHVARWIEVCQPEAFIVENVREFMIWGPLDKNGKIIQEKKGETFQAWLGAVRSLGYTVDYRVLNAADYGDATTRKRLFVIGLKGERRKIPWPEPTHAKNPSADLFGRLEKWRAAREVIDWSKKGTSIFGRKKPLSPNTLRRIEAGIKKFCGLPFVVNLTHSGRVEDVEEPLKTVTGANRGEKAVCEPFVVSLRGTTEDQTSKSVRSADDPIHTVSAAGTHAAICEPFIVPTNYGDRKGQMPRTHSIDSPTPTVVGGGISHAMVEPFLCSAGGPVVDAISTEEPMNTVLCRDHMALVEPFVVSFKEGIERRVHSADQPLPTQTTEKQFGVCEPFLVKYYGTGTAESVDEPLATATAKSRFGLVLPDGRTLDILFRMLEDYELAAAMSFPPGYIFKGNKSQRIRQVGNAWAGRTAKALCKSVLEVVM